jgi:hypothetical protein
MNIGFDLRIKPHFVCPLMGITKILRGEREKKYQRFKRLKKKPILILILILITMYMEFFWFCLVGMNLNAHSCMFRGDSITTTTTTTKVLLI